MGMEGIKIIYKDSGELCRVELDDGKWAFVDKEGKLQKGRYKDAAPYSYSEGLACVQLDDGNFAFIDKNGKLQEGRYKHPILYFVEGLACVELDDGKWAFIDKNGKLQEGRYKNVFLCSGGHFRVLLDDGKWTFVDKEGKLQKGRYNIEAYPYSEGFAAVYLEDRKCAFIDKKGKLQEGRYRFIEASYSEGFAGVVLENGIRCQIDYEGNLYLSQEVWLKIIKEDPFLYKFIPPHRFDDEDFMDSIEQVIKDKYILNVKEVEPSSSYAKKTLATIQSEFDDFCKVREEKIKSINEYKKEINDSKEELISKISDFGNSKRDKRDRG